MSAQACIDPSNCPVASCNCSAGETCAISQYDCHQCPSVHCLTELVPSANTTVPITSPQACIEPSACPVPSCNCSAGETCTISQFSCYQCPSAHCLAQAPLTSNTAQPSRALVAVLAVTAVLAVIGIAAVCAVVRRSRQKRAQSHAVVSPYGRRVARTGDGSGGSEGKVDAKTSRPSSYMSQS